MAHVVHVQYALGRRIPVVKPPSISLIENLGVAGDFHARPNSSRQVLLMAQENCELFGLGPGEVRENILTRGLNLQDLRPGTRLRVGGAIVQIAEDCAPCAFIDTVRPGLKPRMVRKRGMLARVVGTGRVGAGDAIVIQ